MTLIEELARLLMMQLLITASSSSSASSSSFIAADLTERGRRRVCARTKTKTKPHQPLLLLLRLLRLLIVIIPSLDSTRLDSSGPGDELAPSSVRHQLCFALL